MTPQHTLLFGGILCLFAAFTVYQQSSSIPVPHSNKKLQSLQDVIGPRSYNILSLGGSTTWGTTLRHRTHAYPYIIGSPQKKVLSGEQSGATGIFTGSSYPSLCIESVVGSKTFDVILLEFSLDGHDGIELLLKRLRIRYPNAIIIYVHLYSLATDIVDGEGRTPADRKEMDVSKSYNWGYGEKISNAVHNDLKQLLKKYGANIYALPRTQDVLDSMYLFSSDWHHLSQAGHNTVAEGIMGILIFETNHQPVGKIWDDSFGSLDNKDQCNVWFADGKVPFERTGDTEISKFEAFGGTEEYALEISGASSIFVESTLSVSVPLYMFFMTKVENYPFVEVSTDADELEVKIVDPVINSPRDVMKSEQVGWAEPGRTEIKIKPISESEEPFRVTGFALCEACLQLLEDAK